jgi:hypothetical protein
MSVDVSNCEHLTFWARKEPSMKVSLFLAFAASILVVSLTTSAHAESLLTVSVNGGPAATFTTTGSSGTTNAFVVGGVSFTNIIGASNQPGSATTAFATDTTTAIFNGTSHPVSITIGFADNNFSLPNGTTLQFNAGQSVTVADFAGGGAITQTFVGFGDSSNSLAPGTGIAAPTTTCTVSPLNRTNSCDITSAWAAFTRGGNLGVNGIEMFSLAPGQVVDFQAAINAVPLAAVPEPGTLLLLSMGVILLAGRGRRVRPERPRILPKKVS